MRTALHCTAGLIWPHFIPLRLATHTALGCAWGRGAATTNHLASWCAVAVGPAGPAMDAALTRLARIGAHFSAFGADRDPTVSAAAKAYLAGSLRMVWMDGTRQAGACKYHLKPAGLQYASAAGAEQQQQQDGVAGAGAVPSGGAFNLLGLGSLLGSACGSGYSAVDGLASVLGSAAAAAGMQVPRPPVRLYMFRPAGERPAPARLGPGRA